MSSGFDWLTEEEEGWDDPTPGSPSGRGRLPKPTLLQSIIGVIFLVILLGVASIFAINRVSTNTERIQADVLTTHQLLIRSVLDRDVDRFTSMLSEDKVAWKQSQIELLRHRLVLGRRPLGFSGPVTPTSSDAMTPTQVILSPQLDKAVVQDFRLYEIWVSDGVTGTVKLERTFHYQLNGTSWQLTGIIDEDEYWGTWHRVEGDKLTLVYPGRDADLGARLASELDRLLLAICNEPSVSCPVDFHLIVRMNTTEASLMRLQEGVFNNPILAGFGPETMDLPAPSLIGRPVDEAGYSALYQGYASWLGATILADYGSDYMEIDEDKLDDLLSDWGLMPMPRPELLLPFRARIAIPPGVALPEQDIMMLCTDPGATRLLQLNIADGKWSDMVAKSLVGATRTIEFPVGELSRLPNYDGAIYILAEPMPDGPIWRTYFWQSGRELLLTESEQRTRFWPPIIQPDTNSPDDIFLAYRTHPDDGATFADFWSLSLLDCYEGDCQFEQSPRLSLWAPGWDHALLIEPDQGDHLLIYRSDGEGLASEFLGRGHSPTWIDNDTFAYVSLEPTISDSNSTSAAGVTLLKGSVKAGASINGGLEPLLTSEQLRSAIPEAIRPDQLMITSATHTGGSPGRWYLLASNQRNIDLSNAFLFKYDEAANEIELIQSMPGQAFSYSSQTGLDLGQYSFLNYDGTELHYKVLDLNDNSVREYAQSQPYDQSADGLWLLFVEDGSLRIVSPKFDFDWTIEHGLRSCYSAVWINRNQ